MTDHLTDSERALREAAEKATKGEWFVAHDDEVWGGNDHLALVGDASNRAYIVAAQPRAVLALLDEIERLRGALHLFPNPQKFWEEAKWAGEVSNWWHAHKEEIDCAALAGEKEPKP
jgi:hypothetical protein